MVDVERKSLMLVKKNVKCIKELVSDKEFVEQQIFGEMTYIDEWNPFLRERLFDDLMRDILKAGVINDWAYVISNPEYLQSNNGNFNLFWAAVFGKFGIFFEVVYEVYLLDQLIFILNNLSEEDIENEDFLQPFKTGSTLESSNFNLDYEQVTLYNDYREESLQKMLAIQSYYIALFRNMLNSDTIKNKIEVLRLRLEKIKLSNPDDNIYVQRLYQLVNSSSLIQKGNKRRTNIKDNAKLLLEMSKNEKI